MIDIPSVVQNKARDVDAHDWLDGIPDLIAVLEREWSFRFGRVLPDATEAVVAEVTMEDATPAVLKLLIPRDGEAAANEIVVLRLVAGDGCPRLFREDADRGAMLMERLGPSLHDLALPIERRHQILAQVAARIWRPVGDIELPDGAAKVRWLVEFIASAWADLDHPCSEQAVDHAIGCAERRFASHDRERSVLVHGDVHEWNALQDGDVFKAVDPDGFIAEPECDLGVIMREDPVELRVGDPWMRAHRLAGLTGTDPIAIWEWGVVERVATGLLLTKVELQPIGSEMLATADLLAAHHQTP